MEKKEIVNKGMFRRLFLPTGRIARLEYVITTVLVNVGVYYANEFSKPINCGSPTVRGLMGVAILVLLYIQVVQIIKRCHDVGHNGFWMLIPFYSFVLLFLEGDQLSNKYGTCPEI